MSDAASELAKLRAALAAAEVRADVAESELAQARAVVSCSEAMIQEVSLRSPNCAVTNMVSRQNDAPG